MVWPTAKATVEFNSWMAAHEGAVLEISEPKKGVSGSMRGYLFGAVIPFLKRLVPEWEKLSNDEVYEVLKKAFNYFEAYNPVTKRVERYGQSAMASDVGREEGEAFLRDIGEWVTENYGRPLPDVEAYKRWIASAPLKGEAYSGDG